MNFALYRAPGKQKLPLGSRSLSANRKDENEQNHPTVPRQIRVKRCRRAERDTSDLFAGLPNERTRSEITSSARGVCIKARRELINSQWVAAATLLLLDKPQAADRYNRYSVAPPSMQNTRAISSAKLAENAARSRAKETRANNEPPVAMDVREFNARFVWGQIMRQGRKDELDELNRDKFNERACFDTDVLPIGYNYTTVNCAVCNYRSVIGPLQFKVHRCTWASHVGCEVCDWRD